MKSCLLIKTEMLDGCIISAVIIQIVIVALHPDGVLTLTVAINVVVID